jgi:thioredoxin 1
MPCEQTLSFYDEKNTQVGALSIVPVGMRVGRAGWTVASVPPRSHQMDYAVTFIEVWRSSLLHQPAAGGVSRASFGAMSQETTAGTVEKVTDETFDQVVLTATVPVVVDFWAEWCQPCLKIAPVLAALAAEHPDTLKVVKLNADENPKTTLKYQVMSMPTLLVFQNGEIVRSLIGARPKSAILRELADFV